MQIEGNSSTFKLNLEDPPKISRANIEDPQSILRIFALFLAKY